MRHGVKLVRKGVSGKTENQQFEFDMRINNPALTGTNIGGLCACFDETTPGAYIDRDSAG